MSLTVTREADALRRAPPPVAQAVALVLALAGCGAGGADRGVPASDRRAPAPPADGAARQPAV